MKSFQDFVAEAKKSVREITPEELKAKLDRGEKIIVLDVREKDSHLEGHVPGAASLPRGAIEMDVDEHTTDPNACIVTHCGGGSRSALAAQTLQDMGYKNVFSLAGGLKGWKAKGFEVER